ncbi:MAG: hypothetical protein HY655_10880 [Acidobacteria bacterium]|nr:hypothetical protein [Acidobacteriota bacterium]
MSRVLRRTLLLLVLATCSSSPQTLEGPAAEIRALTGARTRVVWVQGDGTRGSAEGDRLILMGFDTDDGRGERVILGERRSYVKPLLTPRSDRIIFSSRPGPQGPETFIVSWDGTGLRRLAKGFALAVWQNPADGREWVYIGTDNEGNEPYDFRTVTRVRIDAPSSGELVWNKTMVSSDTFQVSADGRLAAGLFPWPEAGVAELPNRSWRKLGEGCWTALSDAGSRLFWYFDGAHRNLTVVDLDADTRWVVNINQAPGFGNAEVYHPRWSNHPRFLTLSGPYNQGGDNQVRSGGAQTEVYLGRFSADLSRVEAWARVTHNFGGDSYPDVWIDRNRSPYPVRTRPPVSPAGSADGARAAPGSGTPGGAGSERLVVQARLIDLGAIPLPKAIAPYRHALVVNGYEIVNVLEGAYGARKALVAQWAIRDGRVLAAARKTVGTVYRLTLEPYDAHPELEGERLVMDSDAPGLRLYYEVGAP